MKTSKRMCFGKDISSLINGKNIDKLKYSMKKDDDAQNDNQSQCA